MNKNEILKGLSEVYHSAKSLKEQLNKITQAEIWSKNTQEDRDKLVGLLQDLYKTIDEISDIQRNLINK